MKKLMSMLLVAIVAIGFALPAAAAGAISAAEQTILDELNAGVKVNGQSFYFNPADIKQAENQLKVEEYAAETTKIVVTEIQAARKLVEDNSAGIVANSLNDLLRQLPKEIRDQIFGHIQTAARALGLVATLSGSTITISNVKGETVITPVSGKNPVVKATGANYTTSLVAFSSLMIAVLGAAIIGKKYARI